MTRSISASNISASSAAHIIPVEFVELLLDTGAIRVHSQLGDITWSGNTYTGVGSYGGVSGGDEATEVRATNLTLRLSGVPVALTGTVLAEDIRGRIATRYMGFLDTSTNALVDTPLILFKGRMDSPAIETDGTTSTITINVEHIVTFNSRPAALRYNSATQKRFYPDDKFFDFAERTANASLAWGAPV
jgi:hypothetical protein